MAQDRTALGGRILLAYNAGAKIQPKAHREQAVILERIHARYSTLTGNQKRLADYIVSSYHEAAFLTASALARQVGMDESTVVRFAQRLGYAGYPEMVRAIRDALRRDLSVERLADEEPAEDALQAQMRIQLQALTQMVGHLPADGSHGMLEALGSAERIHVLGQGLASPLAQLLAYGLRSQGLPAESPPPDAGALAVWLQGVGPRTVVMALSTSEEADAVANALGYARERGAQTMALCCSPVSACAQVAEMAVACTLGDRALLPEISALALIIEALLRCLAAQRGVEQNNVLASELQRAQARIAGARRRSAPSG